MIICIDDIPFTIAQHVLEHGKPHERSVIIEKLAGQIIQMSQQKFASNVVEKCLTFGGPAEREVLINEMLGTTDENEPLQVFIMIFVFYWCPIISWIRASYFSGGSRAIQCALKYFFFNLTWFFRQLFMRYHVRLGTAL